MVVENVSYMAIWTAAVSNGIISILCYSPLFLGKKLSALTGIRPGELRGAGKSFIIVFLGSLVSAWVLELLVLLAGAFTVAGGALVAALAWLGFYALPGLVPVFFEGRPLSRYLFNGGYTLLSFVVMGIILAVW